MTLFDLAADMELGFFLSYYRNFAIPGIAETLAQNGEIPLRPMKRSYDTAIAIYELIANGFDSDRGRAMVTLLNRVHRHVPGTRDDFLYVLITLLVVPIRWVQRHAWRQPTAEELEAATRFFAELGKRMNIPGMHASFSDAERFFDDYEAANIGPSAAGQSLLASTVQVFQSRLPLFLRPVARPLLSAMLDDDRLVSALGLPRATGLSRGAVRAGLWLRNGIYRRRPLSPDPHFVSGQAGSSLYPGGYSLGQIGPINVPSAQSAVSDEIS